VNRKISEKDKKTWDEFLSNNQKLPDKDNIQNKTIIKKTRSLDLHGENLDQANSIIENFIKKSYEDRIQKLIIVTGKGLHSNNDKDPYVSKDFGILKYSIPEFVRNNQDLMKIISNISEASVEDGGTGAFYIFLKKK
jgi:DNA-nicking Smr family endonuclease